MKNKLKAEQVKNLRKKLQVLEFFKKTKSTGIEEIKTWKEQDNNQKKVLVLKNKQTYFVLFLCFFVFFQFEYFLFLYSSSPSTPATHPPPKKEGNKKTLGEKREDEF